MPYTRSGAQRHPRVKPQLSMTTLSLLVTKLRSSVAFEVFRKAQERQGRRAYRLNYTAVRLLPSPRSIINYYCAVTAHSKLKFRRYSLALTWPRNFCPKFLHEHRQTTYNINPLRMCWASNLPRLRRVTWAQREIKKIFRWASNKALTRSFGAVQKLMTLNFD